MRCQSRGSTESSLKYLNYFLLHPRLKLERHNMCNCHDVVNIPVKLWILGLCFWSASLPVRVGLSYGCEDYNFEIRNEEVSSLELGERRSPFFH